MAKNKNKKMARVKSGASKGSAEQTAGSASDSGEATKKKRVSPIAFVGQVRAEVEKVTWPSRNEWFVTTIMVLIMVVLASSFFFLVDIVIKQAIQFVLSFGG